MREDWTRDQLLLAFNLYCKIPFSKTKANNPAIIQLARLIRRSPAAVAMKLGNFGSFDPALRRKGISGLSRASKADKKVWDEFNHDWEKLTVQSESAMERYISRPRTDRALAKALSMPLPPVPPGGASESIRLGKVRLHQRFFRAAVIASYGIRCCVCNNPIPELLTAGHIIPWSHREDLRANPHNGLCLCSLHHTAFDCGLFAVDRVYKIIFSSQLLEYLPNETIELQFTKYSGACIRLPEKFQPEDGFLAYHRKNIFIP